jgi:hypothetical protein
MAKRFTHDARFIRDADCVRKRDIRRHFLMLLLSRPEANFWRAAASIFRMYGRGAVTPIRPIHPGVRQPLRADASEQHRF